MYYGRINVAEPSAVHENNIVIASQLQQNYPNPFRNSTNIGYTLSESGSAQIDIYDQLGTPVRRLVSQNLSAGKYSAYWDGKSDEGQALPGGVYYSKMVIDGRVMDSKRMVIFR